MVNQYLLTRFSHLVSFRATYSPVFIIGRRHPNSHEISLWHIIPPFPFFPFFPPFLFLFHLTIHPFLPFNLFFSFSLILLYLYYPQSQCISSQQHYLAYSSWDSFIRVFHLFSTSLTSSVTFWRLSELKFSFDANSLPKSKVFIISGSVCTRSAERSYERTFNKINKKISKTYYERTASNTDNTWQWGLWELSPSQHLRAVETTEDTFRQYGSMHFGS